MTSYSIYGYVYIIFRVSIIHTYLYHHKLFTYTPNHFSVNITTEDLFYIAMGFKDEYPLYYPVIEILRSITYPITCPKDYMNHITPPTEI